ncbi:MAG: HNH endonuclease [Deltaproteobacteria bacterium]|nr:HNH endonuclease [Deltaproteobacteria bacterium]
MTQKSITILTSDNGQNGNSVTSLKRCSACGAPQDFSNFGADRSRPDGLNPVCKDCRREKNRQAYAANPERQKAASARYAERNRELLLARRREHGDEIRESARAAYAARMEDPAKRSAHNAYHRRYRAEHRERIRQISAKNHEKAQAEKPEQIERKRHRRRDRERRAGFVTRKLKFEVFERYGPHCYLCGGTATSTDHYRPLAAGGATDVENLRPVCKPCNSRKGSAWPFDEGELRARILAEYELETSRGDGFTSPNVISCADEPEVAS